MKARGRRGMRLAGCVVLVSDAVVLSGCAIAYTGAFGKDSVAALYCTPSPVEGVKTTKTTTYDDKIGLKPQIESLEVVTEPAPPAPVATHKAKGSDVGDGIAGVFRGLGQFFRALVPW